MGDKATLYIRFRCHDLSNFIFQGLELDESDSNPAANSSGFFPLLATITDFPFPTIALITGHTFGKHTSNDGQDVTSDIEAIA
jgi:hypothetical protein